MINWKPTVETVYGGMRTGFVELPNQATESLPRVGEGVSFPDQEICRALQLKHTGWYTGTVTGVRHILGPGLPAIEVTIEITAEHDSDTTREYARDRGIYWFPYDPVLPARAQGDS